MSYSFKQLNGMSEEQPSYSFSCSSFSLSNHPDFVGIIPILLENPEYAIGIVKIPISTRVVIFSSNSHKRKRNAEYQESITRSVYAC